MVSVDRICYFVCRFMWYPPSWILCPHHLPSTEPSSSCCTYSVWTWTFLWRDTKQKYIYICMYVYIYTYICINVLSVPYGFSRLCASLHFPTEQFTAMRRLTGVHWGPFPCRRKSPPLSPGALSVSRCYCGYLV